MKKITALFVCLVTCVSFTCSKAETVKNTHENVEQSAVSLEFVVETAGNGVVIHHVSPNIYYVLSAGHLCNIGVNLEYISQWLMSKNARLIERAKSSLETIQSALDAKLYCAPSVKRANSIGIRGKALAVDFDKDLILFMFTSQEKFGVSKIENTILPIFGQDIYAYGYVFHPGFYGIGLSFFGKVGSIFPMSLSPLTENSPTTVVQSSLGVSHGLSGSGIYTLDHKLLGILSAEASLDRDKPIRLSLFIHPSIIRLFLVEATGYYYKHKEDKVVVPYCKSADPMLCDAFLSKKFNIYRALDKKLNRR